MNVCPTDGTPLVSTFERPGAEWHCLACGQWWPLLASRPTDPTGDLTQLHQHLADQFRAGVRGPVPIDFMPAPIVEADEHIKCDGCGTDSGRTPDQGKPSAWYSRRDADGEQFACSRDCITTIAAATGKSRMVLPW